MISRKIRSSSRPEQQCHANVCFCLHLENITPPIFLPLPCAQSPSPPSCFCIALLSHTHPYFLISHFHTNLPDKLSPLSSTVCLRLAFILQKTSFFQFSTSHPLYMSGGGERERHHPRAETSIMPRGTSARPHHRQRQQPQPTHLQSHSNAPSASRKLCLLTEHPHLPLF